MESPICTVCTIPGCSGLLIVQIWCIDYALLLELSRYTKIVYMGVYLVLT